MNSYSKQYYEKNKQRLNENSRKRYKENADKYRQACKERYHAVKTDPSFIERNKQNRIQFRKNNPEKIMWYSSKNRAKKLGIDFNIDVEDIVIPDVCPYLGISITKELGNGRVETNASIDRVDSSKGYIKGNIQIISDLANRMKQDATSEQLIAFAKGVLKIHNA